MFATFAPFDDTLFVNRPTIGIAIATTTTTNNAIQYDGTTLVSYCFCVYPI